MLSDISQHVAINAAAITSFAALAFRDQLKLRLLLLVSLGLTVFTTAVAPGETAWDSLFWTAVSWLVNAWMIGRIILDRTHIGLTAEEERLFAAFGVLTPGEFRQLVRRATWRTAEQHDTLTVEGTVPDRLFYVLEGTIEIIKANRTGSIEARTFIGEIAFLRGTPASATVSVAPGTRYLEWRIAVLTSLLDRRPDVRLAVTHLLGADMALKVARAGTT